MSNVGAVSHSRAMHLAESAVRYANTDRAEYEKALSGLVATLPELDPKERKDVLAQLRSTDARVFAQLQSRDDVQKSAKLRNSIKAVIARDTEHLGTAAHAKKDATPIQLNRFGSGEAEVAALLAAQVDKIKTAGPLARAKKTEIAKMEAEREGHPAFSAVTRALGNLTRTAAHEHALESAKGALQSAEAKAADKSATKKARAAARATVRGAKATIKKLNGDILESRGRGGFILDEAEAREFLAHHCDLENRLTDEQKAAADLDLEALLSKMGGPNSVAGQIAGVTQQVRAGDPAAKAGVETMVADMVGLDPELQQLSPTVKDRLAQLREQNPEGYKIISEHLIGQERSQQNAKRCYHEIMGLINSGMPIESVIMLVMILLAEREEEKFNDKVKELTAYEQIDKMNAGTEQTIETLKQIDRIDPSGFQHAKAELEGQIQALDADGGVEALKKQLTEQGAALKAEREAAAAAGPSKEGEVRKLDQRIAANDERLALLDTPNGREELLGKLKSDLALVNRHGTSLVAAREIGGHEANKVDPKDFGLKEKSSTIVMQELQVQMQMYMQVMQALAAVLRQIQDLVMTPVHNIR